MTWEQLNQFGTALWTTLLALAPWLLLGCVIAGLVHVVLPPTFVHRQLRGPWGVTKAVLLGVPLPLCSCGVIPAGLGLKKDGASDGAAVGFMISTPQTGVDSILVSASFLGWPFALFKVAAATVMGLIGGLATDRLSAEPSTAITPGEARQQVEPRKDRLRAFANHALDLLRTIWSWIVLGIVLSAAIEVWVPRSVFAQLSAYGGLSAALITLVIALPLYVCATASVPIAAALVAGGMPTGAALVFLIAGPATNLATVGAVYRSFGRRTLIVYLATVICGSIGLGLAFDSLIPGNIVPRSAETHQHGAALWEMASAVVLVALLLYFAAADARRFLAARLIQTKSTLIETGVEGMTCNGCVSRLEQALRGEQGIRSVTVTLKPGRAQVTGTISKEQLQRLVDKAGFKAS
jgi:uncharacterized membrane protein YraQ (UPF0718 family)/copper chaperone CopZ